LKEAEDEDLQKIWARLAEWYSRASRRKEDTEPFVRAASYVLQELKTRKTGVSGALAEAAAKVSLAKRLEDLPEVLALDVPAVSIIKGQEGEPVLLDCGELGGQLCAVKAAGAAEEIGIVLSIDGVQCDGEPLYHLALVRRAVSEEKRAPPEPKSWLEKTEELEEEETEPEGFTKVLCSSSEEDQVIYYLVSEPDTIDAHGHQISSEAIEKALWGYMASPKREVKLEHSKPITGRAVVVEGYVAPADLETFHGQKPSGGTIKAGSSIAAIYYEDKALWERLSKEDHGISWGGEARKEKKQ